MIDKNGFGLYLKRGGRSASAIERCIKYVEEFARYLAEGEGAGDPDAAGLGDLDAFVAWIERAPGASAKTHLWALSYYYDFTSNSDMRQLAIAMREERIKRTPLALSEFQDVRMDDVQALAAAGVTNIDQMLRAGQTPEQRTALAAQTGISPEAILHLVQLSDLARIPGVKGVRAALYHTAGVDSVETLSQWEPEALRRMLVAYVEQAGIDNPAPFPKEIAFSVAQANRLPKIVKY